MVSTYAYITRINGWHILMLLYGFSELIAILLSVIIGVPQIPGNLQSVSNSHESDDLMLTSLLKE